MSEAILIDDVQQSMPVVLSTDSLDAYLAKINTIPILSVEREQLLARDLRDQENLNSARELILSHLRFVAFIARGYSGYGLPLADLIQEGNVGLMKAVKRFDPDVGVRLVSFAVHWIRAEIHEYILRNWRIVKIATTKAQRKLFFKLRSSKKRLAWLNADEVKTVAENLGVDAKTVLEMEERLSSHDVTFDRSDDSDDQNISYAPANYLQTLNADPARLAENEDTSSQNIDQLELALEKLDERSRDILKKRWLSDNKATLHELAAEYHISAERIRQLEANAIKKLRSAFAA